MTGQNPAIFLDRDGTLVHARHYPSQPEQLVLFDDLGERLRRLQSAGFRLVVITNQAGLARGYFTPDDLALMHRHLSRELTALGVTLDAIYHCPHHPDGLIADLAVTCDCRKPAPGMILQAAADLDLDVNCCWLVGDILHDVEAGNRAGCRTILVDNGGETEWVDGIFRVPHYVARDTCHALDVIAAVEGIGPMVDLAYRPAELHPLGAVAQ